MPWSPIGLSEEDTVFNTSLQNVVNDDVIAETDNLLGTQEFGGTIVSNSNKEFSVKVEWHDELGNTVYTQEPSELQNITTEDDYTALIDSITVKSNRCTVRAVDESGDSTNEVSSTINFH